MRELNKTGILENERCALVEPEAASINSLQLVHDNEYIQRIRKFCGCGGGLFDKEDTVVSGESYEVASRLLDPQGITLDQTIRWAFVSSTILQ